MGGTKGDRQPGFAIRLRRGFGGMKQKKSPDGRPGEMAYAATGTTGVEASGTGDEGWAEGGGA
jgi:hypothetical protein